MTSCPSRTRPHHVQALPCSEEPALPWRVEMIQTRYLKPARRNARTHSKKQIGQIAHSIARFGVIAPVVVDDEARLVAGHARVEAAKLLGLKHIPAIRVSHLSEAELRAYMLADNRLALSAGWDRGLLALEFEELQIALPEIDLDLGITGFEPSEIDAALLDLASDQTNSADQIPEVDPNHIIAKAGDVFVLGHHRLVVGDARDQDVYARLMKDEIAEMAFLDPPYNVRIQGNVGGRGRIKRREFAHASGELTSNEFIGFLRDSLAACAGHMGDGSIAYVCIDWRHVTELHRAGSEVFDELKNICIWVKSTPGQGSFYRSQHEFVFVYKKGTAPHINTFELGQHGRLRSNVWNYPGANTFRAGRMDELKMHPTVKPVALVSDAMRDCSRRNAIILDTFCGSGTTIVAAEQVGRRAYCIEIDRRYADVAIRRWQKLTGKDAALETTGQMFDEIASAAEKPAAQRTTIKKERR